MLYVFDGGKDGFLTTLAKSFLDDDAVISSKRIQLSIGEGQVCVETNFDLAKRIENRLISFDGDCLHDLDILLRCGEEDNEQVAYRYFKKLAAEKSPIGKRLADPDVFRAVEYMKKVGFEIHRFHGFIRFMETASGALYAPFSPDNDICDLLLPHFRARLPQFAFVLHDVKRQKAAVYDGKTSFVAPLKQADVLLSGDEAARQKLWKDYYAAVNIPSRERFAQMRGYMPKRYWKFLPEHP